ncbi:MAG: membrane protease YdiL (CAAX protease family) [Candidatus Woesearchaeota archaeon]
MNKKNQVLLLLLGLIVLTFMEMSSSISYFLKITAKLLLFVMIPLRFLRKHITFLSIKNVSKKTILYCHLTGIVIAGLILGVYKLLFSHINFTQVAYQLEATTGVTPTNFLLIGAIIVFLNSFIEEFFFRGILHKKFGMYKTSAIFAVYHISIFVMWFSWWISSIALVGLFVGGIIFSKANEKSKTIYPGWIIHMWADIAIIVIGLQMFGFF